MSMKRWDFLAAGLLVLGLILYLLPYSRLGVDFHHDGIMLKPALDVLSGQILFRDTFMQYGALTCYLQVLALWLHPSLFALKLVTIAAYVVALVFFFASWRLILPRSLALIACGLLIWFIPAYEQQWPNHFWIMLPWSSAFAMSFQSIALFALLKVIRGEESEKWGLILGLTTASVFWSRQPVGIILLGCVVAIWAALILAKWNPVGYSRRTICLRIFLGFVIVNILLLGGIWLSGATADWWYQNFIWPQKWAMAINDRNTEHLPAYLHLTNAVWMLLLALTAGIPALLRRFQKALSTPVTAVYYLGLVGAIFWQYDRVTDVLSLRLGGWTALIPLLILLHSLVYLGRVFQKTNAPWDTENYVVAAMAVVSLGSSLQYLPVTDPWHIMWALGPCFGLVIYQFWRWVGWSAGVVSVVVVVALLPAMHLKVQEIAEAMDRPMVTLTQPSILIGMKVTPGQAEDLNRIMHVLIPIHQLRPDIPSAMIGNDALYLCFATNRENPTPYFVTWPGLAEKKVNQRRWNYIKSVRPLMILQGTNWATAGDFYRKEKYVPLLYLENQLLELAVPKELADAMGVTVYGKPLAPKITPAK